MRSPFPGMDPYLEEHWGDVHASLIVYARGQLQRQLPSDLCARVEERVFVESEDVRQRSIKPDVRVVERRNVPARAYGATESTGIAVAEPLVMDLGDDEARETYIDIKEVKGDRVITTIEFLSPANKLFGEGRKKYIKKRREMKAAGVNIVEIDLTRTGRRNLLLSQLEIPPTHRATYQACVWRAAREFKAELYAFPLEVTLPALRIPLRRTDNDVTLQLQALIDQCYEEGRYDTIDYSAPPEPPLEGREASWARNCIKHSHSQPTKKRTGSKNGLRRNR